MTIGSIAAVSPEWVIGVGNKVPWHHAGDMRRFKRVTLGTTIIMGRLTWESMNKKALPGRRNLVVTSTPDKGVECFADIHAALMATRGDVWFVGGARIYADAMEHVDLIDLTFVPEHVLAEGAVKFPAIDPERFEAGPMLPHEDEAGLSRRVYTKKG
jgi:dihydrofolate reductase